MEKSFPSIPAKRYFTISEVGSLCGVKPHVLRYWEQEFSQLRPAKRRGNRRYYQLHEVELIRKIRELLYEQGFTIVGARNKLLRVANGAADSDASASAATMDTLPLQKPAPDTLPELTGIKKSEPFARSSIKTADKSDFGIRQPLLHQLREELVDIRNLLEPFTS